MSAADYNDLSREQLVALLERRDREARRQRRFGLVWERDEIERETALNADFVALEPDAGLACGAAPYGNLIVEGDNFDALRFLRMTHGGKVKCIYIDPPYNTGNRDFVYNDRFLDREDAFRHSKWIEFMHRRLTLARELLRDDGVIFIHIGEEEMAHLSCLMDQLFPGMKVGTFVWKTRSGANDSKNYFFSQDHEYVLCYAGPDFSFKGDAKDTGAYKNPDNDPRGPWINDNLVKAHTYMQRKDAFYPIQNPEDSVWYACDPDNVWRFASETKLKPGQRIRTVTMEQLIADKKILWPKDAATVSYGSMGELLAAIDAGKAPRNLRRDLPDLAFWIGKTIGYGKPRYKRHLAEVRRSEKPLSSWLIPNAVKKEELAAQTDGATESLRSGYTSDGTSLVQDMLNNKDFPYPKPLSLVQALLAQATGPGDLVVDFFAGSGTTGHAVLALNAEDGGERCFILVSCTEATAAEPDKNVCRDITQRRMAAAVNGYTVHTNKGFKSVAGLGGGFAYLRARRVPLERLADLAPEQVWLAVALFHLGVVPANAAVGEGWYAAETASAGVAYLPRVAPAITAGLRRFLTRAEAPPATVYTHQPSALRQRLGLPDAEALPVPATIAARFGLEVSP